MAKLLDLWNSLCNSTENADLVLSFVCQNYCVSVVIIVIMRIMSLVGMKEYQFIRTQTHAIYSTCQMWMTIATRILHAILYLFVLSSDSILFSFTMT